MNESKNKPAERKITNNGDLEAYQKHWFCVAISASGDTFKEVSESPAGIQEILNGSAVAWVDYRTDDFEKEAPVAAIDMGFSDLLISSFIGDDNVTYQDFDTEMGMRFPSVQVRQLEVKLNPLLVLLRRNFILTIHPLSMDRRFTRLRRYSDIVLKKIPITIDDKDKLTILLTRIVDENNERNFDQLREIEERGDKLNKELADPDTPREVLGPRIYHMKHALITYLNALWETVDVLHALRYGDADLVTDDTRLLDRIGVLIDDVNRQIGLAEHMSEVLASGLEVLQTIDNNQLQALNNRMALVMTYLTIAATAVLVPNTLATIFGSSAFQLGPEDIGWYTTLLVLSTVIATGLVYWWVRKRGWIPKMTKPGEGQPPTSRLRRK